MKNVGIKIIILTVAILATVGAVVVFIPDLVAPPMGLSDKVEEHGNDVKTAVNAFSASGSNFASAKDSMDIILDKLTLYTSDGLLSNEDHDAALKSLLGKYTDAFTNWAFGVFNGSSWEGSIGAINGTLSSLRGYQTSDGKSALSSEHNSKLSTISAVISNYNQAMAACNATNYTSDEAARSQIAAARNYLSQPYLKNCSALAAAVSAMPNKITMSHKAKIEAQIAACFNSCSSFSDIDNALAQANGIISGFASASYGGNNGAYVSSLQAYARTCADRKEAALDRYVIDDNGDNGEID